MEYWKTIKLLYDTMNQSSKFRTRNWNEINDKSRGDYNDDDEKNNTDDNDNNNNNNNNNINNNNNNKNNNNNNNFKTSKIRWSLCSIVMHTYLLKKL